MLPKGQRPESLFRFKQLVMSPCKIKIKRLFTYKIQWCRMSIPIPEGRGINMRKMHNQTNTVCQQVKYKVLEPRFVIHECGAVVWVPKAWEASLNRVSVGNEFLRLLVSCSKNSKKLTHSKNKIHTSKCWQRIVRDVPLLPTIKHKLKY